MIDAAWRYYVYSPESYAAAQDREFSLSGLAAWSPVRTGVVPEAERASIAAELGAADWDRFAAVPTEGAPDQGLYRFATAEASIECAAACPAEAVALLEVADRIRAELYEAGADFEGPAAVTVFVADAEREASEPPDTLDVEALVAMGRDGAPVGLDDSDTLGWLRAERAALLTASPLPPQGQQFIGLRTEEGAYEVYFRDLPPEQNASTGEFAFERSL